MSPQVTKVGKEKILEVSEKLFAEHGYRAVSIRDIAKACNVTNAALYYHFKNKDDLFEEVLERHGQHLSQKMFVAAEGTASNRQRAIAMLSEYAVLIGKRRSSGLLMRHKTSGMPQERLRQQHSRFMQILLAPLENTLTDAIKQGELKSIPNDTSAASILLGMLHGLYQYRRMCHDGVITQEDIRFVVDVFWRGLGNE